LDCPIYKIASYEITDIPLIQYTASKGKPLILSTGIAALEDIELAIAACREIGNDQITFLKCTSSYPSLPEDANLITIPDMKSRFGVEVGLSDHTLGIEAPVIAVALGAKVIEKHFILDKSIGGPDAHFSLDETEFKQMVDAIRKTESMLGRVDYKMDEKKKKNREFCRSLYVVQDIQKGQACTEQNIRSIRPGYGLHPKHLSSILGKTATRDLQKGTALNWEHVSA
jgi:pseudaminic acid synthase